MPVRWLDLRVVGDDGPALQAPDALEEPRSLCVGKQSNRGGRAVRLRNRNWGLRELGLVESWSWKLDESSLERAW